MSDQKDASGGIHLDDIQGDVSLNAGGDIVAGNKTTIIHYGDQQAPQPRLAVEPETVLIPQGKFHMGSLPGEDVSAHEMPLHAVCLDDFNMAIYPTTNAQYYEFIQQSGEHHRIPKNWRLRKPSKLQMKLPVTMVSWHDALAYCQWLSELSGRCYALPNEAQWEKAARGDGSQDYPWGETLREGVYNESGKLCAVDAFPQGASPYGCLDMLGNIQQWCQTLWGESPQENDFPYPYQSNDGRENLNGGSYRIVRGGSYKSEAEELAISRRGMASSQSQVQWRGFRVVEYPQNK